MEILSLKPGHDGAIALLKNGKIEFCFEGEKNSYSRHCEISPDLFLNTMGVLEAIPDTLVISGWVKGFHSIGRPIEAGYYGHDEKGIVEKKSRFLGKEVNIFSSTHERSHLMSAYGMSPWPQGQPCYALVWEGNIGAFYEIDKDVNVSKIADVLEDPGNKYAFLYTIANQDSPIHRGYLDFSIAGKQMALTGFAQDSQTSSEEKHIIESILEKKSILLSTDKLEFQSSKFFNIGVESQAFKNLAAKFSNAIFDKFYLFAKENLNKNLPLLISGGCGLNGDWNRKWKESKLFSDIFIPPCPNDSGSAIGSAVDAQYYYTGDAKVSWNVYCGAKFIIDSPAPSGFLLESLDYDQLAKVLADGGIIAWVQGNCELGPRALGNRSILSQPFSAEMRKRLNKIKQREDYRPVAPICLENEVNLHFDWQGPSPYMLYFSKVKASGLDAITHVDKTARVQTVTPQQNQRMARLLECFKRHTGVGVLCNTSLNFKGKGFINSLSDLVEFVEEKQLDGFVVGDTFYKRKQ